MAGDTGHGESGLGMAGKAGYGEASSDVVWQVRLAMVGRL